VPSDTFRSGQLNYVDTNGNIQTTTTAQLQAIDPQGVGADAAFLNFITTRYPVGNDPAGDGLNTTGFLFNAPDHRKDNIFTARVDYVLRPSTNCSEEYKRTGSTMTRLRRSFPAIRIRW